MKKIEDYVLKCWVRTQGTARKSFIRSNFDYGARQRQALKPYSNTFFNVTLDVIELEGFFRFWDDILEGAESFETTQALAGVNAGVSKVVRFTEPYTIQEVGYNNYRITAPLEIIELNPYSFVFEAKLLNNSSTQFNTIGDGYYSTNGGSSWTPFTSGNQDVTAPNNSTLLIRSRDISFFKCLNDNYKEIKVHACIDFVSAESMFSSATNLEKVYLYGRNKIEDFESMVSGLALLNSLYLEYTSNGKDFNFMLANTPLLKCVNLLDTRKKTGTLSMFLNTALEHPTATQRAELTSVHGAYYKHECKG